MSEPADNNDFGIALTYSARAPLTWNATELPVTAAIDSKNEQSLRTILNLSEHHNNDVGEEFAALERKVDITLEMVASLLRASIDMPSEKEFQLGAHEIRWQQTSALPSPGEKLNVIIYLHELYPMPLTLAGQVRAVTQQECVVQLATQTPDVQQLLEKFIFLHHRRSIAHAKQL